MKHIINTLILLLFILVCGCSSGISAIGSDTMPCRDYIDIKGSIRGWGQGTSDNKSTARKKAFAAAAAEMASSILEKVKYIAEEYSATRPDESSESKRFLIEKSVSTVNENINNAVIVCDEWRKDKNSGMYTNYVVLELKENDCVKTLIKKIKEEKDIPLKKELIEELLLKCFDN